MPSQSTFSATGGMLRGLLMRRQSSQPATPNPNQSVAFDEETSVVVSEPLIISETAYGDVSVDAGGEVRFSVELTRIDRLNGTYSLEVRRLKGNLNSYGYLYETFRQCASFFLVWWAGADFFFFQTHRFTTVEDCKDGGIFFPFIFFSDCNATLSPVCFYNHQPPS